MLKQTLGVSLALLVAGCATAIGPAGLEIPTLNQVGYELGGHRIRGVNVTPGTATTGAVNYLNMQRDGRVTATVDGSTQVVPGTWGIRNGQVCFTFPVRGTECWPYPTAMQIGETRRLTSDRGLTADITLLALAP